MRIATVCSMKAAIAHHSATPKRAIQGHLGPKALANVGQVCGSAGMTFCVRLRSRHAGQIAAEQSFLSQNSATTSTTIVTAISMEFLSSATPGRQPPVALASAEMALEAARQVRGASAMGKSCLKSRFVGMGSITIVTGLWTTIALLDVPDLRPVMELTKTATG